MVATVGREVLWKPVDVSSRFIPQTCLDNMFSNSRGHFARETDWVYLPNGILFHGTVVFPDRNRSSKLSAQRIIDFIEQAISHIESRLSQRSYSPQSLSITVYLWDGKKLLPLPGKSIGPENINTGVTTRTSGGTSRVLVYRREDMEKTIVHELLHCYHIGDWCNEDPVILKTVESKSRDFGLRSLMLPTESVVDYYAILITCELTGVPLQTAISLTERVMRSIDKHFRPHGRGQWKETSNVFCYVVMKLILLHNSDILSGQSIDNPNRTVFRNLFSSSIPFIDLNVGKTSKSLRMFPHV